MKLWKWLKKHKTDIVDGAKFFILVGTMVMGFWWTYMFAWWEFGLPIEWWSVLVTLAVALLSLFGFMEWCVEG